jgi:ankyrin repeat protein
MDLSMPPDMSEMLAEIVPHSNIEGFTTLHKAVFHQTADYELPGKGDGRDTPDVESVAAILREGDVDVNARCILGQTALMLCVRQHYKGDEQQRRGVEMVRLLLAAGSTVVEKGGKGLTILRDSYGDNLLHLAAMASHVSGPVIVKMLIDHCVTVCPYKPDLTELLSESCDNFRNTPLHWITVGGNYEAAKYMLDHGARLGKKNKHKEKCVDYALQFGHTELQLLYNTEQERRAASG